MMNVDFTFLRMESEGSDWATGEKQNNKEAAKGKQPLLLEKKLLAHAHYHEDGTIEVNPLSGELPREESATPSGVMTSLRGRASVNANGSMVFKPYREKTQRKRPLKVFASAHCTIKLLGNGTLKETWRFDVSTSMSEASILREREMQQVNEFWANF